MRLEIPGFVEAAEAGLPSVPVKRAWVKAVAGRDVRIASVRPSDVVAFSSLRPSAAEAPEVIADQSGVVQAGRRRQRWLRTLFRGDGLYPEETAHVVSVAFQGEVKKALMELAPLRWDPGSGQLLLARRLVVRLTFAGRVPDELGQGGSRGHHHRERGQPSNSSQCGSSAVSGAGEGSVRGEV